jgi:hypothetical protein
MERFAFSLDEDAKKWLQDRSDELDISRAELLRRLIAHAQESDTPVIHGDTAGDTPSDSRVNHRDTDSDTLGDTHGRSDTPSDTAGDTPVNHGDTLGDTVAEHGERLADLEARVEGLEAGDDAIAPTPLGTDARGADVEPSDAVVDALEASGWSHGRNREERERDAAVAAWALEVLREADRECRRADVPLDALDDDRKTDTVWLEVVRPALLAVAAETDAVETSTNDQRYRWVGE